MFFSHSNPSNLLFGKGCVRQSDSKIGAFGQRCLIVTSANAAKASGALADVTDALDQHNITCEVFNQVQQNPELLTCAAAAKQARCMGAEFVIGIGGGSALDAAKAVCVLAANPEMDPMQIFDLNWTHRALPLIAVGTTAGTGSEVNSIAVLTMPNGRKRAIKHPDCFPALSLGDPLYTASLPYSFTLTTALDALSHTLEGYFSTLANPFSDTFAKEAVAVLLPCLRRLAALPQNFEIPYDLREPLYLASLLAGYTLSDCGTCYCHALGYFLSEEYEIAHGAACAVYLPDFVRRQTALLPEKASALYAAASTSPSEVVDLIGVLTRPISLQLTPEQIRGVLSRSAGTKNFEHTAPAGYSHAEAEDLLVRLFGAPSGLKSDAAPGEN